MSTSPSSTVPEPPGDVERNLDGWSKFWFTPIDPTLIGLIRICVGIMVVYVHLVYHLNVVSYFGEYGWIDVAVVNTNRLEDQQYLPRTDWAEPDNEDGSLSSSDIRTGHSAWSVWFHVTDPAEVERVHLGMLVIALLFTLGIWTRVTGVLTWLAYLACMQRVPYLVYGMDIAILLILFYLVFGDCGATLSIDRLLARRFAGAPPVPNPSKAANFALRLMQVHLCFIYLIAGLCKLQGSGWWNGTAVWNTLVNYELSLVRYPWYSDSLRALLQNRWMGESLVTGATLFTLSAEIGFPFLVWHRKLRWLMIWTAIALHAGIGLFMGLAAFGLSMMILVMSFIPPEQAAPILHRLIQWGWPKAANRSAPAAESLSPPVS